MSNPTPSLYLFDMDHTLIDNDCDVSWKEFLIAKGLASPAARLTAAHFFEQYNRGELKIDEFMAFQLAEFRGRTPAEMAQLAREHFHSFVRHTIYEEGRRLVADLLAAHIPVALLTSTNEVVAHPAAKALGITDILATPLEIRNGKYTGKLGGAYCGGEGKIGAASQYCSIHGCTLAEAAYYGDSVADIPLLSVIGFPRPTNPSAALKTHALAHGWPVISFTEPA